tara:strand:- start:3364 stop:3534 length:171 start_codon:yes stop_codon:yes gene_type:complete
MDLHKQPNSWLLDEPFKEWLFEMKYLRKTGKKLEPNISDGLICYMHEAYYAGARRL